MARRLLSSSRSWRSLISTSKSLNPSPRRLPQPLHHLGHWLKPETLVTFQGGGGGSGRTGDAHSLYMLPIALSGLLGFATIDTAYADAGEATGIPPVSSTGISPASSTGVPPASSDIPLGNPDFEGITRKEQQRLENLLRSKSMPYRSFPRFTVAVKGQKITIKFQVPHGCEVPRLIANLSSNLGLKAENRGDEAEMMMRAWDSSIAWQIILSRPKEQKESGQDAGKLSNEGDLVVLISRSLISTDKPEN